MTTSGNMTADMVRVWRRFRKRRDILLSTTLACIFRTHHDCTRTTCTCICHVTDMWIALNHR